MTTVLVGVVGVALPVSAAEPLASSAVAVTALVSTNSGVTYGSSDSASVGTSLIYKVNVANGGASNVTAVQFTDSVPQFLTYVTGSGKIATSASTTYAGASALSEGSGGYSFGIVSGSPTVIYNPGGPAGTVGSGGLLTLFFRATIDSSAANTVINNAATVNFNDSGGVPQPPLSSNASVTVNGPPAITSASSSSFTEGVSGAFTPAAAGSPTPTITEAGVLPTGVAFTSGVCSGTPAPGTAGDYPITFTATNGVAPDATQAFTLTVLAPPTIASFAPSSGPVGSIVTIKGTNLAGASKVTIAGVAMTIIRDTPTKIKVKVPAGAKSGKIKVITQGGKIKTVTLFTVT